MLCDYKLTEYLIVPVEEVSEKLNEGYLLYGSALYDPNRELFLQPIVRQMSANQISMTPKEALCLQWAVNGKTAEETAMILGNKKPTIEQHLANLRRKFCVASTGEAIAKAAQWGYIINGEVKIPKNN